MEVTSNNAISKILKENYLLLTSVPLLIASGWQVFSLGLIGTPYIRFFSTTQLVADAAIILFLLFFLFITYASIKISLTYDKMRGKKHTKNDNDDVKKENGIIATVLFAIVIATLIFVIVYLIILPIFESGDATNSFLGYISVVYMISYIVMYVLELYSYKNIIIRGLVNITVFGLLTFTFIYFNSIFANYSNLENIKNICKTDTCKVRYFNDKYIFIEKEKEGSMVIQIVKFDKLFTNIRGNEQYKDFQVKPQSLK